MKKTDLLIILIGGLIFAYILNIFFGDKSSGFSLLSPLPEGNAAVAGQTEAIQSKELAKIVDSFISDAAGTYGIVIQNLRTGEIYQLNQDREFQPASLYKLWVTAYAFDQIEKGEIERDDTYSRSIAELNRIFDIDEDEAEQTEGTITRTVEEAIRQMITVSHNYSALLLSSALGNSNIGEYMESLGLTSRLGRLGNPPITTPADIAKFYRLLYDGKIVNQQISSEYIDILANQEINDRIPKYLPEETRIAHKTGELGAFKHDAGIIFGKDTILFVALSETPSQTTASEVIADLAEAVFEYFESK